MENIINFDFNGVDIRVVAEYEGKPWFVAKDVCKTLGFGNPSQALRSHCKALQKMETLRIGGHPASIISESDVYRLVMRSKLPSAVDFQDWVCDTVLPSIRNHGGYIKGQEKLEDEKRNAVTCFVEDLAKAVLSEVERSIEKHADRKARSLKLLTAEERSRVSDIAIESSCRKFSSGALVEHIKSSFHKQFE
jgi:prophage antirepressor-like protein